MKVTLLERSPNVWRVRIERQVNGERVFTTETVRGDRIQAEVRKAELLANVAAYTAPNKITVGTFMAQRLRKLLDTQEIRQTTFDTQTKDISLYVQPFIGNIPIAKITGRDLEALYASLMKRGLAKGTLAKIHHSIVAPAFRAARKTKVIAANPFDDVERTPARSKAKPKALTMADAQRVIAAATGTYIELPVLLLFSAGLRRSELVSLRAEDVKNGGIQVRGGKTDAAERFIPLPPDVFAKLQGVAKEGPIFPMTADALTTAVRKLGKKLGLSVYPHKARHTHATHLLASVGKTGAKAVSQRLGHADVGITLSVYQTVLEEDERNLAELAGAFTRK